MYLNNALWWRELGVSVLPMQSRNHKWLDVTALSARGYNRSGDIATLPTMDDLNHWFGNGSRRGVAIVPGKVVVLDFDKEIMFETFKDKFPIFAKTMTIKTSRGYHLHYLVNEQIESDAITTLPKSEIFYLGSQRVTTHGDGYKVIDNGLLNKMTMLTVKNVFTLPIVIEKPVEPAPKPKPLSFRGCNGMSASSDPIGKIKERLTIGQYLEHKGHETRNLRNNRLITNCPLHKDRKPSFWIDNNVNKCGCYSDNCPSGKRRMDLLDLYQAINKCTLRQAIKELCDTLGI